MARGKRCDAIDGSHERALRLRHRDAWHRNMVFEQIAVSAGAERIVVRKMLGRRARLERRAKRGGRLVRVMRGNQLTRERRKHDEPHGDEAKPCGQQNVLA